MSKILIYTNTDSVFCEILTDDFYRDFSSDIKKWFDTSNYERTKYDETEIIKRNKKVLGKMKDELGGNFIKEFVGIASKNYSYTYEHDEEKEKRCKGVSKEFIPKFEEYKNFILNDKNNQVLKENFRINCKLHNVLTLNQIKIALDNKVSKRLKDPADKFKTLALGIEEIINEKSKTHE